MSKKIERNEDANEGASWDTVTSEIQGSWGTDEKAQQNGDISTGEKTTRGGERRRRSRVRRRSSSKPRRASRSQRRLGNSLQIILQKEDLEKLDGDKLRAKLDALFSNKATLETLLKAESFKIHVSQGLKRNEQIYYGSELVLLLEKKGQISVEVNNTLWSVLFDLQTKSSYSEDEKKVVKRLSPSLKRSKDATENFASILDSIAKWISELNPSDEFKEPNTSDEFIFKIRCYIPSNVGQLP
jgi:hypothetical protein